MALAYKPEELDVLVDEYRLMLEPSADRSLSLPAIDLLDGDKSRAYLEKVNGIFEATTRAAVASLFAKRYSCLTIASALYAMSVFDKGMDYAIQNCRIESFYQGKAWLPKIRLADCRATRPARGGREEWRDRMLRALFAGNLTRVWNSLSKSVPISKAVLWENTAIYVFWLYEKKLGEGAGGAFRRSEKSANQV